MEMDVVYITSSTANYNTDANISSLLSNSVNCCKKEIVTISELLYAHAQTQNGRNLQRREEKKVYGLGCNPEMEGLPGMCKALGLV